MVHETARLILRPYEPDDFQAHVEIHNDPDVLKNLTSFGTPTPGGIWRAFAAILGHWQIRGYGEWMVVEKATSERIGRVGFYFPDGADDISFGWTIGHSKWGRGFATEAASAVLDIGLDRLGFDHVLSEIQATNVASIRVAEKIGMTLERSVELDDRPVCLLYGARRPGS